MTDNRRTSTAFLRILTSALALALAASIAACDGDGGDDGILLPDLWARSVDVYCDTRVRCGSFPDQATCAAAQLDNLGQLRASVSAGRLAYDGHAAAACLDAIGSRSCNFSDTLSNASSPQPCQDAFQGTVVDGGVCYFGGECVSKYCNLSACDPTASCCAGSCGPAPAVTPPVPIGGDCSDTLSVCVEGAFCDLVVSGAMVIRTTCKANQAPGQPCETFDGPFSCAAGSVCIVVGPQASTCGRLPARGEDCYMPNGDFGCDSSADACDETTLKCIPKHEVGAACPLERDCAIYATCDSATLTCVANGGEAGSACDPAAPSCLGDLTCPAGVCVLPPPPAACP